MNNEIEITVIEGKELLVDFIPDVKHSPTGNLRAFKEGNTILVIADCICGEDCCMTGSIMPESFFTPNGDQGVRL